MEAPCGAGAVELNHFSASLTPCHSYGASLHTLVTIARPRSIIITLHIVAMHRREMVGKCSDENNLLCEQHPFSNQSHQAYPMDATEVCVISVLHKTATASRIGVSSCPRLNPHQSLMSYRQDH
ncbi:hypothetical protein JOB18_024557 [Solea senegalensis]|uniref:Uncharacterized protein n=1 Tax=Solea senegalensis TaxID=28829 RepID=A0AAV6S3B2_SOLSE|nr:hypothetical protein JOB18_024557 [Solea senegalensis]